ncbi:MAG TPA: branched-chain amino acid ABC transporter permease [Jatrophihabitans sp.]|jgi:ABC-type branched-subunit amino acid transport system permease subunit|uniref:branched-chain amino acid ABC transporter permease n=1 Tax=Jatrophihabitans sp. TaxID=1932789 RepID=UPI002F18290E
MTRPAGVTRPMDMLGRLGACLAGALVLSLMWGPQEGSFGNFWFAIKKGLFTPRVLVFLALGVLLFLAISFWPKVVPFLTRPGVWPLTAGLLTVIASQTLMHWADQIDDAKFATVAEVVANTNGLAPLASAFFGGLAWAQLVVIALLIGAAIVTGLRNFGWAAAALSVIAAAIAYLSHSAVIERAGGADHSLGVYVCIVGYLVLMTAGLVTAMSRAQVANTRGALNRVLGWRPGLPLVLIGAVLGLISMSTSAWFSPENYNATLIDTSSLFRNSGLAPIASQYLLWLGWALFATSLALSGAASYLRIRPLGWAGLAVGWAGVALTVLTLYRISSLAAKDEVDGATGPWQNLGAGGWGTCAALFLIGAGGYIAATAPRHAERTAEVDPDAVSSGRSASSALLTAPGAVRSGVMIAVALALFYPPTANGFWQSVLVSQIGIYVLLAIGLNVVVGWAGLLDLGFIAFYAIGSYTTAYLVGSLPVKPPSWLNMSPLLAIPFAVVICLLAGLALGAPTLRLRGDYLAIVTLGFGEIIRIVAVNGDRVTNGSQGPTTQVPHPVIDFGPVSITWGLNQLQYWYLLLVFVVVLLLAFRRLEHSRIGRSWAAIREDEVAAQATGINTFRVKLLAFAIGASTSGIAGVFFASQVGFFTPDNFLLNNSILVVAYVVFGGMGSLPGAIAGAALLTWLPEFLKDQVPAADRQMWIGAVVLLMMIFRPGGVLPARRRAVELSGLHERSSEREAKDVPVREGAAR